jgi:hypothetical protein
MGRLARANWFAGYAACLDWIIQMLSGEREYTHHDKAGMLWRFEGGRPISIIVDIVTDSVIKEYDRNKRRFKGATRKG